MYQFVIKQEKILLYQIFLLLKCNIIFFQLGKTSFQYQYLFLKILYFLSKEMFEYHLRLLINPKTCSMIRFLQEPCIFLSVSSRGSGRLRHLAAKTASQTPPPFSHSKTIHNHLHSCIIHCAFLSLSLSLSAFAFPVCVCIKCVYVCECIGAAAATTSTTT